MDLRFSRFELITAAGTGILCLFFVCVFSEVPAIENTISMQVNEAVAGPDLYWSSAEVSGQRVTLTGTAPDVPAKRASVNGNCKTMRRRRLFASSPARLR